MTQTEKRKLIDEAYARIVDWLRKEVIETDNPWPEGRILIDNRYGEPTWILGITPQTDDRQHASQDVFLWYASYILFGTNKESTVRYSPEIPSPDCKDKNYVRDVSFASASFWSLAKEQVVLRWVSDNKLKETILVSLRTHRKALREFNP